MLSVPSKFGFISLFSLQRVAHHFNFGCNAIQVRFKWADWRMARDARKRVTLAENAENKLRINALRKNDILPRDIRAIANKNINQLPRDAVGIKIRSRCAFTSRGNGNVLKWRVSRIVFRDLADHNLLSGVQRAMW